MAQLLRDGIPIEKGMVLTSSFIDSNEEIIKKWLNFFILYPDYYLDMIQPSADKYFNLFPYQRIALRAAMRYRYHFWTACRATSKSFIVYLSSVLQAIFKENSKIIIVSDVKGTVIQIAKQKFEEIWQHWPLLRSELKTRADDGEQGEKKGSGYELYFKNGSTIFVISKDTSRGIRATGAVLEEAALIDETSYNEVIWPQLNVPRRDITGYLNPDEPNPQQQFITTAAERTCFMYGKLVELAVDAIVRPDDYFVWGLSYKVPVKYGLVSEKQLNEQRLSNTMDSGSFARESMSIWTGGSKESWFDSDQLEKRRTLLKCERKSTVKKDDDSFYVIGVDVARYQANTAIVVIKVVPNSTYYRKNVVFVEVIQGKNFITEQAPKIKEYFEKYQPREIVIDGNGLGAGLMDAMVVESVSAETGKVYPPMYAFNDEAYLPPNKKKEEEAPIEKMNAYIYNLKAGIGNDSDIHANCFSQVSSGQLRFLAPERVAKEKLLSTVKGQKMSNYDKRVFLLPYEMTSRMIDEMSNLKLKQNGTSKIQVERISNSLHKDRFSALEYALYRVKYYEDKFLRKTKRKGSGNNNYAFFSPMKGRG